MITNFDYVIVGTGFAGSVLANILSQNTHKSILIIDKNPYIGGCMHESLMDGVMVHDHGPHIFHTNDEKVWNYLNTFGEFRNYQHKVVAYIDGQYFPIPFNINTCEQAFGKDKTDTFFLFKEEKFFLAPLLQHASNSLDNKIGNWIYNNIFKNYTMKQWGISAQDIDQSVINRLPIRNSRDDRYFTDKYQGIPKKGYTDLITKMLTKPNIHIMLNTDHRAIMDLDGHNILLFDRVFKGKVIYTGDISQLLPESYLFKVKLPYRSLNFKFETYDTSRFQSHAIINFPNDYDFTRITEYKQLTGQKCHNTVISREFPCWSDANNIPYYPVENDFNRKIYEDHKRYVLENYPQISLVGRLAEYKYFNMDVSID